MYAVSDAYLRAIAEDAVVADWYGSIKVKDGITYQLTPSLIVPGTGQITREICSDKKLEIGSTCSAELDMSLYLDVERYALYEATIKIGYRLLIGEEEWEDVPLGEFYVTNPPERTLDTITIHAYDAMCKFNKEFGATVVGTPYQLISHACDVCGVELGNTQEEIVNFTNGLVDTYNLADLTIYSYREMIGYLASYMCCFTFIGPDGKLYFKQYRMTADRTISEHFRYSYQPKDYETFYTSITAFFAISRTYENISSGSGGLDYNLETNPFIQFNADELRHQVLTAIITKLSEARYTPFTASTPCDPSIMPGDILNFTGNHAVDGKLSVLTKQIIEINGAMTLECGGDDPSLYGMTEQERRIAAATQSSNRDSMFYYDFHNATRIEIGDGRSAKIIEFHYGTTKKTHVDFHAELKCNVTASESYDEATNTYLLTDGVVEVTYLQSGEVVKAYYPQDLLTDGIQLMHLLYTWWASANIVGSFEVILKCIGCSLVIDQGAARGYIAGPGLIGEVDWDGAVYIEDFVEPVDFGIIHKDFESEALARFPITGEATASQEKRKINFFKTLLKGFTTGIVNNGLHRYSAPYNDGDVQKVNVIRDGNVWKNEDQSIDGTVTTCDREVERILKVTSNRTPNSGDVTYLVSFDGGESWYTYADGFVPYTSDYGMVAGTLASISESEWAEMILDRGTVMIQATLQRDATLTDIQIFTYETTKWTSIGPSDAAIYDEEHVSTDGDQVELILSGYQYGGSEITIDRGHLQRSVVDTSQFGEVRRIDVRDASDGLLTEEQLDLNNWSVGQNGWQRTITYENEVNTVDMIAAGGWEDFILTVDVEPYKKYELTFLFNTPTGYNAYSNAGCRAFVWNREWVFNNTSPSLTDASLLGYSDPWIKTASLEPVEYSVVFRSGNNNRVRIELNFGDVYDGSMATLAFHRFKLQQIADE